MLTISSADLQLSTNRSCVFGRAGGDPTGPADPTLFVHPSSGSPQPSVRVPARRGPEGASLVCISPALLGNTHAQASLTLSSADASHDGAGSSGGGATDSGDDLVGNFSYYPDPVITHLFPTVGSRQGGVPVRVYGQNLHSTLPLGKQCSFGGLVVPASAVGSMQDELVCVSPPMHAIIAGHLEAELQLRVTLNGRDYTNQSLTYTAVSVLQAAGIAPASGPAMGNTTVVVRTVGLPQTTHPDLLLCRFGNLTAAAQRNGSLLTCVTPSVLIPLPGGSSQLGNGSTPSGNGSSRDSVTSSDADGGSLSRTDLNASSDLNATSAGAASTTVPDPNGTSSVGGGNASLGATIGDGPGGNGSTDGSAMSVSSASVVGWPLMPLEVAVEVAADGQVPPCAPFTSAHLVSPPSPYTINLVTHPCFSPTHFILPRAPTRHPTRHPTHTPPAFCRHTLPTASSSPTLPCHRSASTLCHLLGPLLAVHASSCTAPGARAAIPTLAGSSARLLSLRRQIRLRNP